MRLMALVHDDAETLCMKGNAACNVPHSRLPIVQMMDERRKHMERSEQLREAEAMAQQLRTDASKAG